LRGRRKGATAVLRLCDSYDNRGQENRRSPSHFLGMMLDFPDGSSKSGGQLRYNSGSGLQ
jgi:hypothetical protein